MCGFSTSKAGLESTFPASYICKEVFALSREDAVTGFWAARKEFMIVAQAAAHWSLMLVVPFWHRGSGAADSDTGTSLFFDCLAVGMFVAQIIVPIGKGVLGIVGCSAAL